MKSRIPRRPGSSWRRRIAGTVGIAAVAAALLTACGTGDGEPEDPADAGGTLTIGLTSDVGKFDPLSSNNPIYNMFAYATPVYQEPDGSFEPYLAESWEFSDDSTSVTLNLRDDAVFSDGTAVDAQAVVDTMDRFRTSTSPKQFQAKLVSEVTADDEHTVTVSFSKAVPQSYALALLSQGNAFGMVTGASGLDDPTTIEQATLGAGPYVLDTAQTVEGTEYHFVPNEHYFAPETVTYDEIVIKPYADATSLANAATTGQVDFAVTLSAANATSAQDAGLTISQGALGIGGSGTAMIVFADRTTGPTADERVRQAIALALPRDEINDSLYGGWAAAQSTPVYSGVAGYSETDAFAYDVDRARALLEEAGYGDGFTLEITDPSSYDPGSTLGQAVQSALAEIGITVDLIPNNDDFTQIGAKVLAGEFDTFIYTSPGSDVFGLVENYMAGTANLNPHAEELPAEVTELLDAAISAPAEEQDAALAEVTDAVTETAWFATVVAIPRISAVSSDVTGVPETYATAELSPYSPVEGQSWSGQ